MPLSLSLVERILTESREAAWEAILDHSLHVCLKELPLSQTGAEVTKRDREIAPVDLLLACSCWNLWKEFDGFRPTATALIDWWNRQTDGAAVLVLDGLSLREIPWIVSGGEQRGYRNIVSVMTSEVPGETRSFARALGLSQRSQLENDRAPEGLKLSGAWTESCNSPWKDCAEMIGAQKNILFWHHWPDVRIHELGGQTGKGLVDMTREASERLSEDDFWHFIDRLTEGRKLVITSDHGYAASGLFGDVSEKDEAEYLKDAMGSGRFCRANIDVQERTFWVPPVTLRVDNGHGSHLLTMGRRKWRSPGGYPTLSHGGLSILEVAVPFIELSR